MIIDARGITWWESSCDQIEVAKKSNKVFFKFRASCGGEGESWKSELTLAPVVIRGRASIFVSERNLGTQETDVRVYERCP